MEDCSICKRHHPCLFSETVEDGMILEDVVNRYERSATAKANGAKFLGCFLYLLLSLS